ncbi:MAG: hypothetical protein KDD45_08810, partial [Bdellovibrionales bacterium]|nr:hypothetical protein [Bdellovibrionales bacterium]
RIADANNIQDVILYIPKRKLSDFPEKDGWQVIGSLGAKDFYPRAPTNTTTGKVIEDNNHVVIARGRFVKSEK